MLLPLAETTKEATFNFAKQADAIPSVLVAIFVFVGLLCAYFFFLWFVKSLRNKPAYKELIDKERFDEIPRIGYLPFAILIFLMLIFSQIFADGLLRQLIMQDDNKNAKTENQQTENAPTTKNAAKSVKLRSPAKANNSIEFDESKLKLFFSLAGLAHLILLVAVVLLIKKLWKFPIFSALFGQRRKILINILLGFVLGVFAVAFTYLVIANIWQALLDAAGYKFREQLTVQTLKSVGQSSTMLAMTITIVIITPIFEETMFRALLYSGMRKYMNAVNAVLLSSFIFAGVHFSLSAFLPLFFLGAVLATMQERYRSLIPAIITHALLNAATVGYVYYENFVQATTLFR